MSKKIDFSSAIASLQSLNSNTNSIKQTISEVQKIVDDTSNNLSKLENHNGSLAENHHETYYSKLIGTVNHKDIFDEWAIWKINGCNNIQSTINNLINKISNLDNSINQLKLKSINADAAIAIMEKYNVGIEAILASGITLPQDLLDKSFASSQLATNMATDEYKADNREWQGISDENIKWWTDKVLKFEKDPNHIGSNAWLVWQQDENGEWIGMGFTDEKTALEYAKIFNSELINYQEEIQQSIPKDVNANLLNTLYSFGLVSIIPSNQDFNDLKEDLANIRLGTGKKYTGTASEKVLVGLGAENTTDSLAGKEELVSDSGTGKKYIGTASEKVLVGLGAENTTDSLAGKEELVSDSGTGKKYTGTASEKVLVGLGASTSPSENNASGVNVTIKGNQYSINPGENGSFEVSNENGKTFSGRIDQDGNGYVYDNVERARINIATGLITDRWNDSSHVHYEADGIFKIYDNSQNLVFEGNQRTGDIIKVNEKNIVITQDGKTIIIGIDGKLHYPSQNKG